MPETSTVVPTVAEVALNVIVGDTTLPTVKLAVAESPPGFPVAVTVYASGETEATVKLPVNVPLDKEQLSEVTGVPESEHEESLAKKPDPDT